MADLLAAKGAAFVVGSAPCLYDDLARASKVFPFATLMLVNGAATAVENADHLLCGHEEKSTFFVRERKTRFPNAPPIEVHACCHPHRREMMGGMFPYVTRWWPHESGVGATSASKAAKILLLMGHGPIVLVGCPMNQPGYFEGEAQVPQHVGCMRIGDHGDVKGVRGAVILGPTGKPGKVQETRIIRGYRDKFKQLADGEFKNRVYSMSGFTRECLGEPPSFVR